MINIIVGNIGGGKSTLLQRIYTELGQGDGLVNQRMFQDGIWVGQEIRRLSTGEKYHYSSRDGHTPSHWDGLWRLGNLTFSRRGFTFAQGVLHEIIAQGITPVFLDEIGPLELSGYGFHQQFMQLINLNRIVYVAVREECLAMVVDRYKPLDYSVKHVGQYTR